MSAQVHDPKYQFGAEDRIYHRGGEYYVPESEPVMLLRGKDVTALHACLCYVNVLLEMDSSDVVESHLTSSLERLLAFYRYQTENPHVSGVGCSQKHHSGSEKIIEEARLKLVELRMIADLRRAA